MGLDNETWFLWSKCSQEAVASWDFYSCIYNIRYRVFVLFSWKKRSKSSRSCLFFLAWPRKNQRSQGCVCWATPSLRYAVRAANSPSAQTATLRPLHSVPPLNAHQNEAETIDNWRLTMDNGQFYQLIIDNGELKIIFISSFIHETYLATVEAQRAAPHNDVLHNPITINNITNIFIVLPGVLSCRVGWRRSTLRLYSHLLALGLFNR